MKIQEKLSLLEERIDYILNDYKRIKDENMQLVSKNSELQEYVSTLEMENNALRDEREKIKLRIETLLEKIGQ